MFSWIKTNQRSRHFDQVQVETPWSLGRRYWDELLELEQLGEISAALANEIRAAMFEGGTSASRHVLRSSFWSAHVNRLSADWPMSDVS